MELCCLIQLRQLFQHGLDLTLDVKHESQFRRQVRRLCPSVFVFQSRTIHALKKLTGRTWTNRPSIECLLPGPRQLISFLGHATASRSAHVSAVCCLALRLRTTTTALVADARMEAKVVVCSLSVPADSYHSITLLGGTVAQPTNSTDRTWFRVWVIERLSSGGRSCSFQYEFMCT